MPEEGNIEEYEIQGWNGYTGCDIIAIFRFPEYMHKEDDGPTMFAELSTISYSTYKDKFPVRSVGTTMAKGYTSGGRTVAGTLIFKVLNKNIINKMINELNFKNNKANILPDDLPPFDIDITMSNEIGDNNRISLIGVELTEGNQIMSSEQVNIDETYSFVAQDLIVYTPNISTRQIIEERENQELKNQEKEEDKINEGIENFDQSTTHDYVDLNSEGGVA